MPFPKKPARRAVLGREPGLRALFPLWEGAGSARAACLNPYGHDYATPQANSRWAIGRLGLASEHDGGTNDAFEMLQNVGTTSGLKYHPDLPVTFEVLFEAYSWPASDRSVIFCNDGSVTFSGVWMGLETTGEPYIKFGDNTGTSTNDHRLFIGGDTAPVNEPVHLIATIYSATVAYIWMNGVAQTVTPSGAGGTMAFRSTGRMTIGGTGSTTTGADGHTGLIYMARFYDRAFTGAEARAAAKHPWRGFEPPPMHPGVIPLPVVLPPSVLPLQSHLRSNALGG